MQISCIVVFNETTRKEYDDNCNCFVNTDRGETKTEYRAHNPARPHVSAGGKILTLTDISNNENTDNGESKLIPFKKQVTEMHCAL